MKRLFIATLAIVAMSSCAKSDGGAEGDKSLAATFSSTVISRVSGTDWESTDEVGIIVIDKEGEVSSDHPFNAYHTVDIAGNFTPSGEENKIYYSVDPYDYINFMAYYPYDSELGEDLIYKVDVATQTIPTEIDLMEASTNYNNNCENDSAVQFTFTRRLTKFTINLIADGGFNLSDVTGVRFEGFHTTVDYNLWNREFGELGDEKNITPYQDGNTYSAILIPTESIGADHKVVITTDLGDVVWELYDSENDTDKTIALKAGSEHKFNVTIYREDMTATGEILGWEEEDKTEDDPFTTDN